MPIELVSEVNTYGVFMQFPAFPGAYTRGVNEEVALSKAKREMEAYAKWAEVETGENEKFLISARQHARQDLRVDDGDSEILLAADRVRLDKSEFGRRCRLAVKSAEDVAALYGSIRDLDWVQPQKNRQTFYGQVPATAREMLWHMDQIHGFYLSRIHIDGDFVPGAMVENRGKAIRLLLEHTDRAVFSIYEADGEQWTETKILRRLIWHDRIHAKALYRHGVRMGMNVAEIANPFFFE